MQTEILYEPRLTQLDDGPKKYLINRGGQQVQYYPFTAQSSSNSNMVFKLDPPSPSTVLDRNLIIEVPFSCEIKAIPENGNNILEANTYALRAYPFSSVTETLTCIINGQSTTSQLSNVVHMLSRYNNTAESRSTFSSIFPNTLDMYQSYTGGNANSPLSDYENTIPGCYQSRGSYPLKVTGNAAGDGATEQTATISGVIYEYVNISPFYQRSQEGTGGLANIQNLTMNFTMSNLARMLSINIENRLVGDAFTSINVTLGDQPKVYCGFVTTPVDFVIPRSLNFNYNDYAFYSSRGGQAVAAMDAATGIRSQTDLTSPVIQWAQLPEKIYVCARRQRSDLNANVTAAVTSTDTYFAIDSVNINFANQDGIQSATQPENLYVQSVRNGCNMSYNEWRGVTTKGPATGGAGTSTFVGTTGSIACFELGKDIPLQGLDSPSMSGSWNFQIRVKASNLNTEEAITPELCIVAVFNGIMTIENPGNCFISLGIVTPDMVLQSPVSESDYDDVVRMSGGNFGSNMKRFFKAYGPTMASVGKQIGSIVAPRATSALTGIVDTGRDIVRAAQEDARALTQQQGAALSGGMRAGLRAGMSAGALHGGEMIPKSTLRSRAR